MDRKKQMQILAKISQTFSPGAPIDKWELFAGRTTQVHEVINAINQRGHHVILFGERGVGKTSLANVLAEILETPEVSRIQAAGVNCDGKESFGSLWRKIFRELAMRVDTRLPGFDRAPDTAQVTLEGLLPEDPSPEDIRYVLQRLSDRTILIIDELDRISDKAVTTALADAIKTLSDHSTDTTLVLVGVADSVSDLIAEHASVERALVQIQLPRMSPAELHEIIDRGLNELDMEISQTAGQEIVSLSQGLPHYTHLLSLHATQRAALDDRKKVEKRDVDAAIEKAVENAQQSIVEAYHRATSSPRQESLFEPVLLACALASTDQLGYFAAADVREPLSKIMDRPYDIPAYSRHLNDFSDSRGPVLQKTGSPRRYRFRFRNPLMQPFVIMRGRAKGFLD